LRILFLSNYFPPFYRGGYEINCKKVVDELISRGHQVRVITSKWMAAKNDDQEHVHRILHLHDYRDKSGLEKRTHQLRQAVTSHQDYFAVKKFCNQFRPDVAYIWNMSGLSLKPLSAISNASIPIVFDLGDYWLTRRLDELSKQAGWGRFLYRSFLHGGFNFDQIQIDHLLCNGTILEQHYSDKGIDKTAIQIIPRGVENEMVLEKIGPIDFENSISLIYVGRLVEEKGAHLAIEVISKLVELAQPKSFQLDIVGSGPTEYCEKLQQMIDHYKLNESVTIKGQIPRKKLIHSLQNYHFLLVPTIWVEPFGGVVMEAMSQGLCVIASDRGGPAEIIAHEVDGILVRPEDPQAMADAVIQSIENPDLMERMRQAALEKVKTFYVFDKVADQIEAYLQSV
jgi:glycosyltransferase involved in cell wall biosynthesis